MRGGLIAAIGFAAVAAFIVLKMSSGQEDAPPPTPQQAVEQIKTLNIYVAAKPISVGTVITAEMVAIQPWPENLAIDGFVNADGGAAAAVGMVARGAFQQQEPLIVSKLANPNDPNFLAGELPKGMRVVTIPLNEVDGVAGFIFPGDYVDLIFTHDVPRWETAPVMGNNSAAEAAAPTKVMETLTETLLTNVKIVAVDQRASGAGATNEKGQLIIPRSASVMVSQADAQRVRLALKTGNVSMVLRSLADRESSDPLVVTEKKDISQDVPEVGATMTESDSVKILRGAPTNNREEDSSGSSVSRGAPSAGGVLPNPGSPSVINPGLVAIP